MDYGTSFPFLRVTGLAGALLTLWVAPGAGQTGALERLSVHGFLTQAYGISDGHQRLGVTSHGTADYRVAALQFRYDASDRDAFVIQLSHERIGHSPLARLEPEVDLDWVFYERRFGANTTARVGKIRSPVGIYNEIRDVGTLLPMYRPPVTLYGEQFYTSETLDGVMVSQRVPLGDWSLEVDGFFGGWEYVQFDLESFAQVDGGLGTQVWLETPVRGLRLGGSAVRYTSRDILGAPEDFEDPQVLWRAALDGTFPRFFVRAEAFHVAFGAEEVGYMGEAQGYYGQASFSVTDRLGLVAQAEFTDLAVEVTADPQPFSFDDNIDRDLGFGVQYRAWPNVLLKLEGHRYRGYGIEDEFRLLGLTDRANVTYGLFSVSTSF